MNKLKTIFISSIFALFVTSGFSQELSIVKTAGISINELPEYVIITSQNTKLLGGINIVIDAKKSSYKNQLRELESLLQDGDKLRVRNQTDLLNSMSKLGYEFLDAYNASSVVSSNSKNRNDDVDDIFNALDGGEGSFRVNMVFRKKEKFRQY